MAKNRDYKAEYARRIERGVSKGLSKSQARGHSKSNIRLAYDRQLEEGLKEIRKGKPLSQAAKLIRVAPERLRRYVRQSGVEVKRSRKLSIGTDRRVREMQILSKGAAHTISVRGYKASKRIGQYMSAVSQFLDTNDESVLEQFRGESVKDVNGNEYVFETRPNTLYRLSSSQTETFEEVYRIVA